MLPLLYEVFGFFATLRHRQTALMAVKKTCNTVAKKNSKNDVTSPVSTPSTPQYPVPFPIRERTHFQQGSCSLMYYGFQYTRWLSRARDKNEIWSVSYN